MPAIGEDDVRVRIDLDAVDPLHPFGNGLPKRQDPFRRRVVVGMIFKGSFRCGDDVRRGIEIGVAAAQNDGVIVAARLGDQAIQDFGSSLLLFLLGHERASESCDRIISTTSLPGVTLRRWTPG